MGRNVPPSIDRAKHIRPEWIRKALHVRPIVPGPSKSVGPPIRIPERYECVVDQRVSMERGKKEREGELSQKEGQESRGGNEAPGTERVPGVARGEHGAEEGT